MSGMSQTRTLRQEWEIRPRLAELGLNKEKLLGVRDAAIGAAADATPFHPANAPGTLSYQHGTFALRAKHVGKDWVVDRTAGVEGIKNEALRTRIVFSNVDIACDDNYEPQPRSAKGSGAERLCAGNGLFGSLPIYFPVDSITDRDWKVYYLMVAPNGGAELSCPVVVAGRFQYFVERVYLSDGSDLITEPDSALDDENGIEGFDPQIARR